MTALSDLITALTAEQIETTTLSILQTIGFPVASWHKGGVYRTIFATIAKVLAPFTNLQVLITKSGFLDYSESPWLEFLAEEVYGVTPTPLSFATGPLTVDNNAGGDFHFEPRAFRIFNPVTKKVYVNRDAFDVAPNQLGVAITIDAVEGGAASSSDAGQITGIETPGNGLSVTNEEAVVGYDAESAASIRLRCRLKLASLSPDGAAAAHDYVARTFELNGGVVVTRTNGIWDSDVGEVTLYIAGPSGAISSPDVAKVQAAIDRLTTPTGIDVTVVSATNKVVNVTATVWFHSSLNMTSAAVKQAESDYVTSWIAGLDIGGEKIASDGKVFRVAVEGALQRVPNVPVITATVADPAADIDIAPNEVPVPGFMTITAVQV